MNSIIIIYIDKIDKIRETIPEAVDKNYKDEAINFEGQALEEFVPTTEEELREVIKENGIIHHLKTLYQQKY